MRSISDRPTAAALRAEVSPRPSFEDKSRRLLRLGIAQRSYPIEANEASRWQISQPLAIPLGASVVRVEAMPPAKLFGRRAPPLWRLGPQPPEHADTVALDRPGFRDGLGKQAEQAVSRPARVEPDPGCLEIEPAPEQ